MKLQYITFCQGPDGQYEMFFGFGNGNKLLLEIPLHSKAKDLADHLRKMSDIIDAKVEEQELEKNQGLPPEPPCPSNN